MRTVGSGDRDWQFLDWGAGGRNRSFQEGHKEKVTFEGREGTSCLDIRQPPIPVANSRVLIASSTRNDFFCSSNTWGPIRLRGGETGKTFDLDSVLQRGRPIWVEAAHNVDAHRGHQTGLCPSEFKFWVVTKSRGHSSISGRLWVGV